MGSLIHRNPLVVVGFGQVVLKLVRSNLACVGICNFQLLSSGPAGMFPMDLDAVKVDSMSLKVCKLYIQRKLRSNL
jgi:hypothetical protein